jgi:hypothetical protein
MQYVDYAVAIEQVHIHINDVSNVTPFSKNYMVQPPE